jgi:hypothetical protein
MGNENEGQIEILLERLKQQDDFKFIPRVESARGLVRDQQSRFAHQRLRDRYALPLTAAELMRERAVDRFVVQAQFREHPLCGLAVTTSGTWHMGTKYFDKLLTNSQNGVKRQFRFLTDERDIAPAKFLQY